MSKPNATGPRLPIRNRAALRRLIERLRDQSPGGLAGLVEQTEIGRDTLYRWLAKSSPRMPAAMAARLESFVRERPDLYGLFRKAMGIPPGARLTLAESRAWAERTAAPWSRPGTFWERRERDGQVSPVTGRAARSEARALFAGRLARKVGQEVPAFTAFQQWMVRQRIDPARRTVAALRILGPFLDAPESGWVEPSWEELPTKQRRAHVRAAIRREEFLLAQRGTAQQRAEQLAPGAVGARGRRRRAPLPVYMTPEDADAEHQRANPAAHARVWAALQAQRRLVDRRSASRPRK